MLNEIWAFSGGNLSSILFFSHETSSNLIYVGYFLQWVPRWTMEFVDERICFFSFSPAKFYRGSLRQRIFYSPSGELGNEDTPTVDGKKPVPVGRWFIHVYPVIIPLFAVFHSLPSCQLVIWISQPSTVCLYFIGVVNHQTWWYIYIYMD